MDSHARHREVLVSSANPNSGLPEHAVSRYPATRRREDLVNLIVDMISSGVLPSGDLRSEKDLAEELKVSRTPIREALAILGHEGLIQQIPQVGFRVLGIAEADVLLIIDMRLGIEPPIASRTAARPTDDVLWRLDALLREMEHALDGERFAGSDTNFHVAMAEAAGFRSGARTLVTWRNQMRSFRARQPLTESERQAIIVEHRSVFKAVQSQHEDTAAAAMEHHLRETRSRILNIHARE